jgi:uncharacterized protein (AIM24 family)
VLKLELELEEDTMNLPSNKSCNSVTQSSSNLLVALAHGPGSVWITTLQSTGSPTKTATCLELA